MSNFFNELKRRNVFKVAIAYIVAAWLVLQVSDVVLNNITAPAWVFKVVMLLLALGFPFALVMAWAFQMTPDGLIRDGKINRDADLRKDADENPVEDVTPAKASSVGNDKSIAVLPFINMSDEASNEYFSDGISEELLNLLAKIPELRVAARTSSFSLKGKELQISEVGKILNVSHVLEGSVRKAGNQVRITAQLIKVEDGYHLWSENYDRALDNIFAVQDEIAVAVVEQLKLKLLGQVPTVKETDPAAYALFLKGRQLASLGTAAAWEQAIALYEKALAIAPDYAAAWAGLGNIYSRQATKGIRLPGEGFPLAREAASKALALDPGIAKAHTTLGWIAIGYDGDLAQAARHYERALALEPTNPDMLGYAANLLSGLGRPEESIALWEYIVSRDPVNPDGYHELARQYLWARRADEAIATFAIALGLSPGRMSAYWSTGTALLFKGEPAAALKVMEQEAGQGWRLAGLAMAFHALGRKAESDAALAEMIRHEERHAAYNIAYIYAFRDEKDKAFEWLDKAVHYHDPGLMDAPVQPLLDSLRSDPRWLPFLESIGKSPQQLARIKFDFSFPA